MKKGFLKSLADSRKLKYSTLNIVFVAIILAIVIALNSIVTILADNFGWYIDMTDEQIFSLTDEAKELLDDVNQDVQLEIVFPYAKDKLDTDYATSTSSGAIGYIHSTAQQIANECSNITVSYHDVDKDYEFYATEIGGGANLKMTNEHVLIARKDANGKYVSGDFRVYPINYFYVSDNGSLYAYNGELVFISAILAMSRDTVPTVYFTTGHGEESFDKASDGVDYETIYSAVYDGTVNAEVADLMMLFCDSGFTVKPLELSQKDETGNLVGIPEDAHIIVINQPTMDFSDEDIYLLTQYLSNEGTLFAFTPHDATLTKLYSFFTQSYGVTVNPSTTPIEDTKTQFDNTKYTFLADVSKTDNSFATSKYFASVNSYASAKARFKDTATITINPDYMTTTGWQDGMSITKYTYPLLETTTTAVFDGIDEVNHSVMSITSIQEFRQESGDNAYSYLVVCPSSEFASSEYLNDGSSPNKHMILSLIQATSSMQTPVNLDYKPFMDYNLEITDSQARTTTVLLATIIPAVIAITGIVVIIRRKHR